MCFVPLLRENLSRKYGRLGEASKKFNKYATDY